jgi:hypothetical protein
MIYNILRKLNPLKPTSLSGYEQEQLMNFGLYHQKDALQPIQRKYRYHRILDIEFYYRDQNQRANLWADQEVQDWGQSLAGITAYIPYGHQSIHTPVLGEGNGSGEGFMVNPDAFEHLGFSNLDALLQIY